MPLFHSLVLVCFVEVLFQVETEGGFLSPGTAEREEGGVKRGAIGTKQGGLQAESIRRYRMLFSVIQDTYTYYLRLTIPSYLRPVPFVSVYGGILGVPGRLSGACEEQCF